MLRPTPIKCVFRQNVFTYESIPNSTALIVGPLTYEGARQLHSIIGPTVQRSIASAVFTEVGAGRREAGGGEEEGEQEGEAEVTHPSGGELASVGCGLEVRRRSGTSRGWPVTGE